MAKKNPKTGLTDLEEACCHEFIKNGGDQSAAYRTCHKTARKWKDATVWNKAYALFKKGEVQARIQHVRDKASENMQVGTERVLQEYARLAFLDPRKAFKEDGSLKHVKDLDDDTAAALASMEMNTSMVGEGLETTTSKLKFWDKKGSLNDLSRHLGMFEKDNKQKGGDLAYVLERLHEEK